MNTCFREVEPRRLHILVVPPYFFLSIFLLLTSTTSHIGYFLDTSTLERRVLILVLCMILLKTFLFA